MIVNNKYKIKSIGELHQLYTLTLRPIIVHNGRRVGIRGKWE